MGAAGVGQQAPRRYEPKHHGGRDHGDLGRDVPRRSVRVPTQSFLERLLWRAVRLVAMQDNSTCIIDIKRGYSRKMAHLPRY